MDDFTARRHKTKPDISVWIRATGVKLPDGTYSWHIQCSEGHTYKWWAKTFIDWAKIFIGKIVAK